MLLLGPIVWRESSHPITPARAPAGMYGRRYGHYTQNRTLRTPVGRLIPEPCCRDTVEVAPQITEFFGCKPLDPTAASNVAGLRCPFVKSDCIKPSHGACSVRQLSQPLPVICWPNRMYANSFRILKDIATDAFGSNLVLVPPGQATGLRLDGSITGCEVREC